MGIVDYGVVLIYLLGMILIGVYASKKVHNTEDFALGGRTIGPFVIICSSVATASGAGTCIGQAGSAYMNGFSALWLVFAWTIGMLFLAFFAKRIYNTGATSVPEIFKIEHGANAGGMCAIFAVIYCLSTLTGQMIGMGTVIQLMLGESFISYELAVIIGGIITIVYTLQGGFYAVAYTDTVQMIILGFAMLVVLPVVVINGTASATLEMVESVFTPGTFNLFHGVTVASLAAIICKYTFSACTGIPYIQRVLASRNVKEARSSQLYAALGYTVMGAVVMVFAVLARTMYPDLAAEETIIIRVMAEHFPVVLAGLGIAGMVAAVMSTVDSYLLVISQIISQDICKCVKKDLSEESEFKIQRITTVGAGVFALVVALQMTSVLVMFELGAAIYSSAVFFPFIFSLYWKRVTTSGVVAGMVTGGITAIIFQFAPNLPMDAVIFGNAVSCVTVVAVSLMTKPSDIQRARLEQ